MKPKGWTLALDGLLTPVPRPPRACPALPAGVRSVLCEGSRPPRVLSAAEAADYVAHGLP